MNRLIILSNFYNKSNFSMKFYILSIILLSTITMLSGCFGMMAESIAKSAVTDKSYGEIASTLPPIADGNGRFYIYRTKASTKTSLNPTMLLGYGPSKNVVFFTVDDTAYEIIWETFRYIDIPEGHHEVTSGNNILKVVGGFGKHHFQKGENKIQCSVSNGSEIFIRIDAIKEKPFFLQVIVNSDQAMEEIRSYLIIKEYTLVQEVISQTVILNDRQIREEVKKIF